MSERERERESKKRGGSKGKRVHNQGREEGRHTIGHHDGAVGDVSNKVVDILVVGKATVAAIVAYDEEGPEHGALS